MFDMTNVMISIHKATTMLVCLIITFITTTKAFYLPGVAPHDFYTGEPVELKVNKLRYAFVHWFTYACCIDGSLFCTLYFFFLVIIILCVV